jgi:hypothetical protein
LVSILIKSGQILTENLVEVKDVIGTKRIAESLFYYEKQRSKVSNPGSGRMIEHSLSRRIRREELGF